MYKLNNQSKDPCRTLVFSGCILAAYVPLRPERSESVSEMVIYLHILSPFSISQLPVSSIHIGQDIYHIVEKECLIWQNQHPIVSCPAHIHYEI